MELYGIYRIYYSTAQGDIVYQKISEVDRNHCTLGLRQMIRINAFNNYKLPLSKKIKSKLREV